MSGKSFVREKRAIGQSQGAKLPKPRERSSQIINPRQNEQAGRKTKKTWASTNLE